MIDEKMLTPGSVWRHYKGGIYRVVTLCTHESTQERIVIYESMDGKRWGRPVTEFTEILNLVVHSEEDEEVRPYLCEVSRFMPVSESLWNSP